jgi:hypothetical protein
MPIGVALTTRSYPAGSAEPVLTSGRIGEGDPGALVVGESGEE